MKRLSSGLTALAAAMAVAACTNNGREPLDDGPPPGPAGADTEIRDPAGQVRARATAEQVGDSIRVRVEASGLAQGAYGAHVHAVGRCDPPDFASAGPHWNPTGREHGKDNPDGMHKGDLPNLMVGTDGRGTLEYMIDNASLTGGAAPLLDADGGAIVIHVSADDYRTDPSGNSGGRIVCGVLG